MTPREELDTLLAQAIGRTFTITARMKGIRGAMLNASRYADRCSLTASLDSLRLELSIVTELLWDLRGSLPTDSRKEAS